MIAEIWMGGRERPAYRIEDVQSVRTSMDGVYCEIIDEQGNTFETSPYNVVLITSPKEKGGEQR